MDTKSCGGEPMRVLLAIALAALPLAGCASITTGTSENVAVSTAPSAGARCQLANEKGHWTVDPTPGSTTVHKAYGPLTVTCTDAKGDKGVTTVQSKTEGAAYGNILLGGVIGAAVDMSSGAAYLYPSEINVTLEPEPAGATGPTAGSTPAAGHSSGSKPIS